MEGIKKLQSNTSRIHKRSEQAVRKRNVYFTRSHPEFQQRRSHRPRQNQSDTRAPTFRQTFSEHTWTRNRMPDVVRTRLLCKCFSHSGKDKASWYETLLEKAWRRPGKFGEIKVALTFPNFSVLFFIPLRAGSDAFCNSIYPPKPCKARQPFIRDRKHYTATCAPARNLDA